MTDKDNASTSPDMITSDNASLLIPSWDTLIGLVNLAASEAGEWSGAPMPVNGIPLVLEPRYPFPKLNGACFGPPDKEDSPALDSSEPGVATLVNRWYSHDRGQNVSVWRDDLGPFATREPSHGAGKLTFWLGTIGASRAWSLDAELQAREALRGLLKDSAYRYYELTGAFLETSPRSKVIYLFRRNRPTVAITAQGKDGLRILAVLCLHPIGFYQGTWAGCMVPTDDVIAHLMMMRGDEHLFWRKANSHPLYANEAGL